MMFFIQLSPTVFRDDGNFNLGPTAEIRVIRLERPFYCTLPGLCRCI